MGYNLRAVIACESLARQVAAAFGADSRALALAQGFALVPYTDQVDDRLLRCAPVGATFAPFWWLSTTAAAVLRDISRAGALAYVEAEFFGGIGTQQAVVWRGGCAVYGPAGIPDDTPAPAVDTPISQALRCLGVVGASAQRDEFDVLGLRRHRRLRDWLDDPVVEH